jgi:WD40 repeat protein
VWGDHRGVHLWGLQAGKELRTWKVPKGQVLGLALSADGKTLAASVPGPTVRVWEVATGERVWHLDGAADTHLHMALSPDGRTVAIHADNESVVGLWEVVAHREKVRLTLQSAYLLTGNGISDQVSFGNALAFSLNGKFLTTTVAQGSRWSGVTWEVTTGRRACVAPIPTLGDGGALSTVALSSDGRALATGGLDNLVRFTELIGTGIGGSTAAPHEGPVQAVAVTPDGKTVATACEHGGIHLWDTASGRPLASLPETVGSRNRLAFSPDGKLLATCNNQDFRITLWGPVAGWGVPGAHQRVLEGHQRRVGALCFAADGRRLISWGLDRTFRHWDLATGKEVRRMTVTANGVHNVVFARDGALALGAAKGTGKDATTVYLWDTVTGAERRRWDVGNCDIDSLAFSDDGRALASAARSEAATTIRLFHIAKGEETKHWTDPSHGRTLAMAFSPDGKVLATGSERQLRLWDVGTAQQRALYEGHRAPITSIAFAADGRALVTASADTTALVWDWTTKPAK